MLSNTPEQDMILAEARGHSRSLIVEALAGTGKTTTGVLLAHALPLVPILCLAFNKNIATELQQRMPSHCTVKTVNGLCHGAWLKCIGKSKVNLDTGKNYSILKEVIDALSSRERDLERARFSSTLRAIALSKLNGYVPSSMRSVGHTLISSSDDLLDILATFLDDEPNIAVLDKCLEKSITQAYAGTIDFDDQVYMATLFGAALPKYPIVIVDEAQDLSPLNHYLIERLAPDRLIAIGDPYQSIYGFRGADHEAMPKLKSRFEAHPLPLSVTFRVPKVGVRNVHFRVPHYRAFDTNAEGVIETIPEWSAGTVPDGAAIICRNNAPLFACAIRLIRAGRAVKVYGKDIGAGLVKVLKKLGSPDLSQSRVLDEIEIWQTQELARARESRKASVLDRADCLRVFAEAGKTLAEAIAYAEHLFASEGKINLMTGHKAKGLEFDTVFHLNRWLIPSKWALEAAKLGDSKQMEQELNLKYVVETRFKNAMYFVELEGMKT